MDKIPFIFEETGEEVTFAILGSVEKDGIAYLMVVDEEELEDEDMTAYVLKASYIEEDSVVYEIVDDDALLDELIVLFNDFIQDFDLEDEE